MIGSKRKASDVASKGALVVSGYSSSAAKSTHEISLSGSGTGTDSGTGTPAETQGQQPGTDGSDAQRQDQGAERAADIVR